MNLYILKKFSETGSVLELLANLFLCAVAIIGSCIVFSLAITPALFFLIPLALTRTGGPPTDIEMIPAETEPDFKAKPGKVLEAVA